MECWIFVLLAVCGAALRIRMRYRYIEYDEAFTYLHYGSGSFWNAVSNYGLPNNHIFHSVCVWLTTHVLGLSLLSFRLPVLVAGIALVPLTYLLAREVCGPPGAALAAALTAGCGRLAYYSVDARGYGLQAALFTAALLLTPRLVRAPSARLCAAHVVLTSLAIFTVPTLVFGAGSICGDRGHRALAYEPALGHVDHAALRARRAHPAGAREPRATLRHDRQAPPRAQSAPVHATYAAELRPAPVGGARATGSLHQ